MSYNITSEHIFYYPCKSSVVCKPITFYFDPGQYVVELYGAAGGSTYQDGKIIEGGKGGYTRASLKFYSKTKGFLFIGGKGEEVNSGTARGGYNGGGNGLSGAGGLSAAGGGGSTDIRLRSSSIYNRYVVAGGGGGAGNPNYFYDFENQGFGGHGGGEVGLDGVGYANANDTYRGSGGTQTDPGQGGYDSGQSRRVPDGDYFYGGSMTQSRGYVSSCSGGGSGYYGGGCGGAAGGGGGSGFIHPSCVSTEGFKSMTLDGNSEFYSPKGEKMRGNPSNGMIKILAIETKQEPFICQPMFSSHSFRGFLFIVYGIIGKN